jgi:hypothetical protein
MALYHWIGWMIFAPQWTAEWEAFCLSWDTYLKEKEHEKMLRMS